VDYPEPQRRIRPVVEGDLEAYLRLRCDPGLMAGLGGPLPEEAVRRSLQREIEQSHEGRAAVVMIEVLDGGRWIPAGNVSLVQVDNERYGMAEIGWMVLPEFQGRGLACWAAHELLDSTRAPEIWGEVHAYPAVANAPSNAICAALGFELVDTGQVEFNGRVFDTNDWVLRRPDDARSTA
jgi:RimJ/RimL family protein N-acetyltransferase